MELKFGSHCVYQIRYHMVMCIKYRKQLLKSKKYQEGITKIIKEISERYWYEIDEFGTDGDHVHIFIGATGKWAPSRIMQVIKSISAREMFRRYPEIKKLLWGGEFWSDGGYIGTIGEGTNEEIVRKYIQEQGSKEERDQFTQLTLFKV